MTMQLLPHSIHTHLPIPPTPHRTFDPLPLPLPACFLSPFMSVEGKQTRRGSCNSYPPLFPPLLTHLTPSDSTFLAPLQLDVPSSYKTPSAAASGGAQSCTCHPYNSPPRQKPQKLRRTATTCCHSPLITHAPHLAVSQTVYCLAGAAGGSFWVSVVLVLGALPSAWRLMCVPYICNERR